MISACSFDELNPESSWFSQSGEAVSRQSRPLHILAIAYACDPSAGSEAGAGWGWVRLLARLGNVWILTDAKNRPAVEACLSTNPPPERGQMHFVYVGQEMRSEATVGRQGWGNARYLLWQAKALCKARNLRVRVPFDAVWHVTYANAWIGSIGALIGPKFIYGPVGGGVGTLWGYLHTLGLPEIGYELLWTTARALGRYVNPLARFSWSRAELVLVQNPETIEWLPRRHRHKAITFPNTVINHAPSASRDRPRRHPTALAAGRLVGWKGFGLAISAVARTRGWKLIVCGSGRDASRLRRLAHREGMAERVEFRGHVPRDLLQGMMAEADAFLALSMHEDAGWVVAEALGRGTPVVCLSRGGPAFLAGNGGFIIKARRPNDAVSEIASALEGNALPHRRVALERSAAFTPDACFHRLQRLLRSRNWPV